MGTLLLLAILGLNDAPAGELREVKRAVFYVPEASVVVVGVEEDRCFKTWMDACGPAVVDPNIYSLKAVELGSGKVRWSSEATPLLAAVILDHDRVVGLVALSLDASTAAILDPATGAARFTCTAPLGDRGRVAQTFVANPAELVIGRHFEQRGGHEHPPLSPLRLRLDATSCAFSVAKSSRGSADDLRAAAEGPPLPSFGMTFVDGNDDHSQFVDVTVGKSKRRIATQSSIKCPAMKPCIGIP